MSVFPKASKRPFDIDRYLYVHEGTPGLLPNPVPKKKVTSREMSLTDALATDWSLATLDLAHKAGRVEFFRKAGCVFIRIL